MENNKYIIKIQYDDINDDGVGEAPDPGSDSGKGKADGKQNPKISPNAIIQPFVSTALQIQTQHINTITGSGQLARRQQLINSAANAGVGVINKALIGATSASTLGSALGLTAGAGAVIGIAMAVVGEALKIATSVSDLRNKQEAENTSISVTRARSGISWDRSRNR